ncbi:MAG: glycoside hydrolase family 32 protein, partial [Verrucomicrobia bacterium]|nr:glycoside hydrolase family 32 protein [Verrucomicrobiota bacterium]
SADLENYSKAARAYRKWSIENDPYRPLYHFTGVESWINDPNGPIYHEGKYHLFYQYDPIVDGMRSKRCWGHAVSEDLVHWEDWPVAIWPDSKHDKAGVFSGNTFIHKGRITALYTGNVVRGHKETYGMLAWSEDGGVTFRKKMVMDDLQRPNRHSPVHWDTQVWKEGDTWCQLIGGTTKGKKQGAAWLWKSPDLENWKLQRNIAPAVKHGRGFWELPYLLPLNGRYVLMVGAGNPYWIGDYDAKRMEFTPQTPTRSVDTGHYYSFNPHMVDDKGPNGSERRIMHGWARIGKPPKTQGVPYWEQAHSIPRIVSIKNDRLWQEPIPELQSLRYDRQSLGKQVLSADKPVQLSSVQGDALEIVATFDRGSAKRCGLIVRANDEAEGTKVWVGADNTFGIGKCPNTHFLKRDDPVVLHIFVDRGVLEVYCDGVAVTHKCFASEDNISVFAFAEGGDATLTDLEAWKMKSMWE